MYGSFLNVGLGEALLFNKGVIAGVFKLIVSFSLVSKMQSYC